MSGRQFATDSRDQREAGRGYFASAEQAGYLLLTAFGRGGSAESAPVRGVAEGDRAYFWTWSGSRGARLLRHAHAVQVTPCSARGFLTYGLPLSATARLLPGDEAGPAIGKLASRHPGRHRFLIPLLQRARRRQIMIYELVPDDSPGDQGQGREGFRAPGQRGSQPVARLHCVKTRVTECGAASIACVWAAPAHVTQAPAREAATPRPLPTVTPLS